MVACPVFDVVLGFLERREVLVLIGLRHFGFMEIQVVDMVLMTTAKTIDQSGVHTARFLRHLLADDGIEQRLWHVGHVLENKVQEVVVGFVPGFDLLLQAIDLLELFAF